MHCVAHTVSVLCAAVDRETGRAKGFAHIQFDSLEGAAKALGMSGQDFGGREIFIDTAQERTGGGGGGSFGGGAGGGGFERPPRSVSRPFPCLFIVHRLLCSCSFERCQGQDSGLIAACIQSSCCF